MRIPRVPRRNEFSPVLTTKLVANELPLCGAVEPPVYVLSLSVLKPIDVPTATNKDESVGITKFRLNVAGNRVDLRVVD
ncbi:hypothetical protein WN48_10332 [Eufriesea mexicana]|uniref:Uncharacterized protein n=1 Tax=Eufriesea mexicana TaxID=516756 RepID=A0A310SSF9_9HYME|nr:hypothetical protein WN48_10332 [Eufriesea mexicana]